VQKGYIFRHRRSWYLRYYEPAPTGTKKCCKRLGGVDDYPTRKQVEPLAARILRPVNEGTVRRESAITVLGFIDTVYLPHVKVALRASTLKLYSKDILEKYLRSRLAEIRIRDFRTMHGQRILDDIAAKNVDTVNHKTLLRIKSFLSGVFKYARQMGYLDSENPMRDTKCAGRPQKFVSEICSPDETKRMMDALPEPASTIVALAAMSGLRHSEIRGLRWADYDEENGLLHIRRSVWRTTIQETKTESSEDSVPVLPVLRLLLFKHRERVKPSSQEQYIFAGKRRGTPLNLANLVRRVIIPTIEKCLVCRKPKSKHEEENHEFRLDESLRWKGWHAFRRGLATMLYSADVSPKVIAAILRHSDIGTTLSYYVKPPSEEIKQGLEKINPQFPWGVS
jgi:integrase